MSVLDDRTLGECTTDKNLIRDSIVEFLLERGFVEDEIPSSSVMNILRTFAATVAVRMTLPPATKMRVVMQFWDKVMINYVTGRVAHDPMALAKNEATNEQRDDGPRIIVPN